MNMSGSTFIESQRSVEEELKVLGVDKIAGTPYTIKQKHPHKLPSIGGFDVRAKFNIEMRSKLTDPRRGMCHWEKMKSAREEKNTDE